MNNCSNHKKEVSGISDMKELAEMIGDLHYESLADFMHNLFLKLVVDFRKDNDAGRHELAINLWDAAISIDKAATDIHKAWKISKPFMEDKK